MTGPALGPKYIYNSLPTPHWLGHVLNFEASVLFKRTRSAGRSQAKQPLLVFRDR